MQITGTIYHKSAHLNEHQLNPELKNCVFCDSRDLSAVHKLQEKPRVSLFECARCHLVFASRLPTSDTLIKYYSKYYLDQPESSSVTVANVNKFARHFCTLFQNHLFEKHVSIMDFGGGDGSISVAMAERLIKTNIIKSASVTVIDYHEKTVSSDIVDVSHQMNLDQHDKHHDIIIASAILEHIPYVKDEFERLLSHLGPKGLFYARTPYMVPLISLANRFGINFDFTFPGHIHDMGKEFWQTTINEIFSEKNLVLLRSKPSIVETSFSQQFIRTIIAYLLKAPWYFGWHSYNLVGGWEVLAKKGANQ